jgi:hypothetical protein
MIKTETVYEIIQHTPGLSAYQIQVQLSAQSRAARWFGPHSILTAIFGSRSASIWVALAKLEASQQIEGRWDPPTVGQEHRRRRYFPREEA